MSRTTDESVPVATFSPLPSHDRSAALPRCRAALPAQRASSSPGRSAAPPGPRSHPFARVRDSVGQGLRRIGGRSRDRWAALPDAGMSTAEYAIGTVTACAFAGVLYKVITGGAVSDALTELVNRALHAL
ncbi:DUF4244 domain-containing protein [Kitasatospora acidiphila]|nr:DUF4244 domain-containing protein [Kitasatospora acidiphila]